MRTDPPSVSDAVSRGSLVYELWSSLGGGVGGSRPAGVLADVGRHWRGLTG